MKKDFEDQKERMQKGEANVQTENGASAPQPKTKAAPGKASSSSSSSGEGVKEEPTMTEEYHIGEEWEEAGVSTTG